MPKVSVVVPVYNPGRHIDPLLESLARQSLPADEFEVIFVDDGSTDGTEKYLDEVCAEHPTYQVIHIPNSGWPGRPRNLGIDAARGEYVQLVDNDDVLGDEALERLYDYAVANNSDVVVGREVHRGKRSATGPLFRRNKPRATFEDTNLLLLLTPHKMFRRQLLVDNGIRFFEGPRRLEDHPFVVAAYFAADVVSILADYTCYYWIKRPDASNAGKIPREWTSWYGHLRDALDVAEKNTEPGDLRDRLLSHWYSTKGLKKLGRGLAGRTDDDATSLILALRELTEERFPPSVDRYLNGINRVRSALLRAGRDGDIRSLAAAENGMTGRSQVQKLQVVDGVLEITIRSRMVYGDGRPVSFDVRDGRSYWKPPVPLSAPIDDDLLDFTREVERTSLEVSVWDPETGDSYPLPVVRSTTSPADHVEVTATVRLDPETVAFGPLRAGRWQLNVQLSSCAWGHLRALRHQRTVPRTVIRGARTSHLYRDDDKSLWIAVDEQPPAPRPKAAKAGAPAKGTPAATAAAGRSPGRRRRTPRQLLGAVRRRLRLLRG
ncbi:MAG TPA: glycosyltransferase family 2 protein [Mycobacteriales bacterium]|nr:glycosyltransferase family 2 protein [Mycobacteriales bacterium]